MVFDEQGTDVETDAQFKTTFTHVWNQRLRDRLWRLPHSYTTQAVKRE
jgi:hypothetical protein